MQIHQIKRKNKNKKAVKVGRGGKRGKTSGRGHKGQKARAGHRIRPAIRDEIKRLPKLRGRGVHGLKSVKQKSTPVNLSQIQETFDSGAEINRSSLKEKGFGINVKILGNGELKKKISVSEVPVSKSAREKIEKAGGKVE